MHLVLCVVHAKYECLQDFPAVRSRGTYSIFMHGEAQYIDLWSWPPYLIAFSPGILKMCAAAAVMVAGAAKGFAG